MLQKLSFYFDSWLNLVIAFCLSFLIIGHTLPAKADVIYQAFDQPFQEIESQLPQVNKAGEAFAPTVAKMPGLAEGCYQELVNDLTMCIGVGDDGQKYVSKWNSTDKGGLDIPPRSALFFVKQA